MRNSEKFVTAQERAEAFAKWCEEATTYTGDCNGCHLKIMGHGGRNCRFHWLDLEAEEEKPLPCPFCGSELEVSKAANTKSYGIHCGCGYYAPWKRTKHEAIAAHNRVAKKCREGKE